jgi:hypothetical protein
MLAVPNTQAWLNLHFSPFTTATWGLPSNHRPKPAQRQGPRRSEGPRHRQTKTRKAALAQTPKVPGKGEAELLPLRGRIPQPRRGGPATSRLRKEGAVTRAVPTRDASPPHASPAEARAQPRRAPAPGARAPAHQLRQLGQPVSRETPIRRRLSGESREQPQLREDSAVGGRLEALCCPVAQRQPSRPSAPSPAACAVSHRVGCPSVPRPRQAPG